MGFRRFLGPCVNNRWSSWAISSNSFWQIYRSTEFKKPDAKTYVRIIVNINFRGVLRPALSFWRSQNVSSSLVNKHFEIGEYNWCMERVKPESWRNLFVLYWCSFGIMRSTQPSTWNLWLTGVGESSNYSLLLVSYFFLTSTFRRPKSVCKVLIGCPLWSFYRNCMEESLQLVSIRQLKW